MSAAIKPGVIWKRVDPLGEALHFLQMSGVFYTRSEFSAPWGLSLPPLPGTMMFHVVTSGRCLLTVNGAEPHQLAPGDFALVPHGDGHQLLSDPGSRAVQLFDLPREQVSERYDILRHGNGGAPTGMICGAVRLDHPAAHHLLTLLPKEIIVRTWGSPQMEWMHSTLHLMAAEAEALKPGGETVITRLADIMVIQAIRYWIANDTAAHTGWLGALQDAQIGRALKLIHQEPDRKWTVEGLANEAAMSRSAFSVRFTELVEETPMQYVRRWRMYVALSWIKEDNLPLGEMANRLGYESEAAFSRAFKKVIGHSPGSMRRKKAYEADKLHPV